MADISVFPLDIYDCACSDHINQACKTYILMASQITSLAIVYSTIYSGADQRKHQSPASLAFVRGIHRWPVTWKMLPFDDVIMTHAYNICNYSAWTYRPLGSVVLILKYDFRTQ